MVGHDAYLTQCVTSLLANAVKFVAQGTVPEVWIRTERLDGKVRIWFEDNGIGINPLHHERIFQIFGQVHLEAAQRMNGEVGVESEVNRGSRFWLLLNEEKYDNDESRVTAGRG